MAKSFITDGSDSSGATQSTAASTLPPSEILRVSPGKYASEAIKDVDDSDSDNDSDSDSDSEYDSADSESYESQSESDDDSEDDDEEWENEWDSWILMAKKLKAEAERNWKYDTAQYQSDPEDLTPPEEEAAEERVMNNKTAVNRYWHEYITEEVISKALQDIFARSNDDSEGDEGDDEWDFWILEAKRLKAEAERNWNYDTAQYQSDPENLTPPEEEAAEEIVMNNKTAVNRDWHEYITEDVISKALQDNDGSDDDSEGDEGDDEWDFWILEAKRLKAEAQRNWYWYAEDHTLIEETADERVVDIEAVVNSDWQENVEEVVKAVQDNDDSEGDDEWDFWILEAKRWKADAERNWFILQQIA